VCGVGVYFVSFIAFLSFLRHRKRQFAYTCASGLDLPELVIPATEPGSSPEVKRARFAGFGLDFAGKV
jgi:hypothetical protein